MLDWIRKRAPTSHDGTKGEAEAPKRQASQMTGKFLPLYRYLENRYANTVVLTFGQIEDLLGFALPDLARTDLAWWTETEAHTAQPRYSDAWTLGSRTAKPNLLAQNVVFERAL